MGGEARQPSPKAWGDNRQGDGYAGAGGGTRMVDVFISYPQKERELMLPLKRRLEALGLILFVDVDGRLDGSPTFPKALDQGVRSAKAVLGCWSPWALTRQWVQVECAMAKDENKLVAVERLVLQLHILGSSLVMVSSGVGLVLSSPV
jgi:hypothetical protein